MKLRTSFFNMTVFRKDITRFAPAWGIYLIGGLLVMLSAISSSRAYYAAQDLAATIGPLAVVNVCYALLNAELLFGDLFNPKLCNALHAMPLRREGWFLTHLAAGLCFSLVPNFIGMLCMMPMLREFWYVGFIWLLGMEMHYLFFFGVAAFSALCTGNRFAMAAVYALINFFSELVAWFVVTMYEPLLRGVQINGDIFHKYCPTVWMCVSEYVRFVREDPNLMDLEIRWSFDGLTGEWWYLAIVFAVGVIALGLALLLYRRRALETAGDFVAFRPMSPVFSLFYTLAAGALFQLFGDLFRGSGSYLFFIIGLAVGYFTGQMLLQRTVKVFGGKAFLRFAALALLLGASLVMTWLDPLGITRRVPEIEDIKFVEFSSNYSYNMQVSDKDEVQQLLDLHKMIIDEGEPGPGDYVVTVEFVYFLENGSEQTRIYGISAEGEAGKIVEKWSSSPECVLGYDGTWESFANAVTYVEVEGSVLEDKDALELLEAIKADCEAGNMAQVWAFHPDGASKAWIYIEAKDNRYRSINVYEDSEHTLAWLEEHKDLWAGTEK